MQYIASLSYGKDSCAMLEIIKRNGMPLDRIVHVEIMATDTIPADLPPMMEFKKRADKIIKERYGIEVEHIHAPKSYEECFYTVRKHRKNKKIKHDGQILCEELDLLSPIYTQSARGGCWFCHNQGVGQLRLLRQQYPEYWALMLKWDKDSPVTFKADGHTVHDFDKRFQAEDEGLLIANDKTFRWAMLNQELNYRLF